MTAYFAKLIFFYQTKVLIATEFKKFILHLSWHRKTIICVPRPDQNCYQQDSEYTSVAQFTQIWNHHISWCCKYIFQILNHLMCLYRITNLGSVHPLQQSLSLAIEVQQLRWNNGSIRYAKLLMPRTFVKCRNWIQPLCKESVLSRIEDVCHKRLQVVSNKAFEGLCI